MTVDETKELWIFGYGSLIWKPPPHFDLRVPGYIENYVRRFWQASQDHRGTPEDPGRVATLIDRKHWETLTDQHPQAPPRVWGAAYRIPAQHVAEVKEYLDIREINGYSMQYTPFHSSASSDGLTGTTAGASTSDSKPAEQDMTATYVSLHRGDDSSSEPIRCLVYIGLPSNPQFLGPQDPQALAKKIVESRGPSGENVEYLFELETALNDLSPESEDGHISDLAQRCRKLLAVSS